MTVARWNCGLGTLASLACLFLAFRVQAQVVNDGATNTLSSVISNVTGSVTVGTNGSFTLLVLTNGAVLSNSASGIIGRNAGANSNAVRLAGANTRWLMGLDLYVGSNGSFNKLIVSNGALVGNAFGFVGGLSASLSNLAVVTGANSVWSNRSNLYLGFSGSGNRLIISNSGQVFSHSGVIGTDITSSNNEAIVTGANSFWSNRNQIIVGALGNNNRLTVSNGATVFASNEVLLGLLSGSTSNLLLVSGGALLTNGGKGIIGGPSNANFNTVILSGTNTRWLAGDQLIVGSNGAYNSLIITNGASLTNDVGGFLGIGSASGSNLAFLSGAGSRWLVTGILSVGASGAGNRMVVSNGAFVGSERGFVGASATATGNEVVVTGPGSVWSNQLDLSVGYKSDGNRLVVSNGGLVGSDSGHIGDSSGASNEILVTGAGSLWSNRVFVIVGDSARGNRLMVSNGATVFASNDVSVGFGINSSNNLLLVSAGALLTNGGDGILGVGSNANFNTAILSGTNSRWLVGGALIVGSNGAFNSLTISNGAMLASGPGRIGFGSGDGNRATVTGAGSEWSLGLLTVGQSNDSGGALVVSNGGFVRVTGGTAVVGADVGSPNNTIIVDGVGSLLTNGLGLLLGSQSASNILIVTNGGQVVISGGPGAGLTVGGGSAASVNRVFLSGTGTVLTERKVTLIGGSGADNLFVTSLGAAFSSPSVTIGSAATASNNSASLADSTSTWMITNTVTVGDNGAGNLLSISLGALLNNGGDGFIGARSNANFNTAFLSGASSRWLLGGDLFIGSNGAFNRLVVSNGGFVKNVFGRLGSAAASGNNDALVTGVGSVWSNQFDLSIGDAGSGNRLVVSNGGLVIDDNGPLGSATNSANNQAIITGTGSLWTNSNDLTVGLDGSGNRLVVSNGGVSVSGNNGFLGFNQGSSNNEAVVTGSGSLWSNRNSLSVGEDGGGSRLVVSNGGTVFASNSVVVGATTNSFNNRLIVDGGTLRATNAARTSALNIRRGTNVLNAGLIDVDRLVMTTNTGRFEFNGGTLTTRGAFISNGAPFVVGRAGSTPAVWDVRAGVTNHFVSDDIIVGSNASFNQLLITNGALLMNSGFGRLGFSNTAASNVAIVSGTGSRWIVGGGALLVGQNGGFNRLVVTNGGFVTNEDNGTLGLFATSSNNEAVVTGAGSRWSIGVDLFVGNGGSGNRLIVSNGGEVLGQNHFFVGSSSNSANNRLIVDGGTLQVTNVSNTGVLDVRRGTNVLNAGLIEVDRLLVTNAAGAFEFTGGRLVTENTTNSNGRLFRVGNGTSAATLQLLGGTHAFSNNLVISSNASLIGTGTILGTVTNFGTISAGSSAGSLRINGSLTLQSSATMAFELGGLIATNQFDQVTVTNFVQFAGTLSLSLINNFLPDDSDSFTLITFVSSSGAFTNAPSSGRVDLTNHLASFAVSYTPTNFVLGDVQYVDSDGDGQGDLREQAAMTNPNDSANFLQITFIAQAAANHIVVQFQSVSGKSYSVEYSNDLVSWMTVSGAMFTSAGFDPHGNELTQWIDDGSLTGGLPSLKRFYRIGL